MAENQTRLVAHQEVEGQFVTLPAGKQGAFWPGEEVLMDEGEPLDRHVDAGLFVDLTPDGILCRLAMVNSATDGVVVRVDVIACHQHAVSMLDDGCCPVAEPLAGLIEATVPFLIRRDPLHAVTVAMAAHELAGPRSIRV